METEKKKDTSKIVDRLLRMEKISEQKETEIKNNWKEYENFFIGAQWGKSSEKRSYGYNSYGEKIIMRYYDDLGDEDDIPKRTQNEIFLQVQTELSLHLKQNYYVVSLPVAKTDKAEAKSKKQNLFFAQVLGRDFAQKFMPVVQDVLVYGDGFFKVVRKLTTNKKTDVPFSVVRIPPQEISADPHAREFENIKWIIHKYKKYAMELKEVYEKLKALDVDDFTIIELKEFWVKQDNETWKRYVLYKNTILNENEEVEYPSHPFVHFKHYNRPHTWWGISETELWIEHQRQINKRLSQYDMYLNMLINPPIEVNTMAISPTEMENFPLKAFQHYAVKQPGAIRPIMINAIAEGQFFNSIENAKNYIRRIGGVSPILEGSNEQGVYSAKHFGMLFESAINRMKLKESFYRLSFATLGKTLLEWGKEYLGKTGKFLVYDAETDKEIVILPEDLDYKDIAINLQTSDANLLNPQERLNFLVQMKQYAPELDTFQIILDVERMFPTFFDDNFIAFVKNMQKLQRSLAIASAELQLKQLQMQAQQFKMQEEQMNAQPSFEEQQPQPPLQAAEGGGQETPAEQPEAQQLTEEEQRFANELANLTPENMQKLEPVIAELKNRGADDVSVLRFLMQGFKTAAAQGIVNFDELVNFLQEQLKQ